MVFKEKIVQETQDEIRERYLSNGVGLGMSLGVAVGAGFGVVLDNLSAGIGIGISIGAAIGIALGTIQGNKHAKAALESSNTKGHDGGSNIGVDGVARLRVPITRPRRQ